MSKRKGAASLEFVFAFSFLLIFFVIIISFQIITIHRIATATSTWRIQRVGSIIGSDNLFVKTASYDSHHNIIQKVGFGDLVLMTLKSANITVSHGSSGEEYTVKYYSPFLQNIEEFFYGSGEKNPEDKIEWIEPNAPPEYDEHDSIGAGG